MVNIGDTVPPVSPMKNGDTIPSASPVLPRTRAIPKPYVSKAAAANAATMDELQDKVKFLQAENRLLGGILDDAQSERKLLERQLAESETRGAAAEARAEHLNAELGEALIVHKQKQSEACSMTALLDAQEGQLEMLRSRQSELEELVVELSEKLLQCGSLCEVAITQNASSALQPSMPLSQAEWPERQEQQGGGCRSPAQQQQHGQQQQQQGQQREGGQSPAPQPRSKPVTPTKLRQGKAAPRFPTKGALTDRGFHPLSKPGSQHSAAAKPLSYAMLPSDPHQPVPAPAPMIDEEFRSHMSRIEWMYQSKAELLEQQYQGKVQHLEDQYRAQQLEGQYRVQHLEEQYEEQYRQRVEEQDAANQLHQAAVKDGLKQLIARMRNAAAEQVDDCFKMLEKQGAEHLRVIEQLDKRCNLLETLCHKLKASMLKDRQGSTAQVPHKYCTCTAQASMLKDRPGSNVQQLGTKTIMHKHAREREEEEDLGGTFCNELEQLRSQVLELESSLKAAQSSDECSRGQSVETSARLAKAKEYAVKYVEEVHALISANTCLNAEKLGLLQQLAAAESAINGLRSEAAQLQGYLLDAQSSNVSGMMKLLESGAKVHRSANEADDLHTMPEHLDKYVRGLLLAVSEVEAREASLRRSCAEAHYLEGQARRLLCEAREEQVATHRALLTQMRRMQTLEEMRLGDVMEISGLALRPKLMKIDDDYKIV